MKAYPRGSKGHDNINLVRLYLNDVNEFGTDYSLGWDKELELIREYKRTGSLETRDRIIVSNLINVFKIASPYAGKGMPFEELLNEGNIGLMEALEKYDADKGVIFMAYARYSVIKKITKAFADAETVKIPYDTKNRINEIRNTRRQLSQSLKRKPTNEEIADMLHTDVEEIDKRLQAYSGMVNLDEKVGRDGDTPLSDFFTDRHPIMQDDYLIANEMRKLVLDKINVLPENERTVLFYRFGIGGYPKLNLDEIGKKLRISRETARRREAKGIERLRKMLNGNWHAGARNNKATCHT